MGQDSKLMSDLADQLGLGNDGKHTGNRRDTTNLNKEAAYENAKSKAENFKDKSDEELLNEINKLKQAIKKDRKAYEQQMTAIKAMRGIMTGEQRKRLDKIIELMES